METTTERLRTGDALACLPQLFNGNQRSLKDPTILEPPKTFGKTFGSPTPSLLGTATPFALTCARDSASPLVGTVTAVLDPAGNFQDIVSAIASLALRRHVRNSCGGLAPNPL